MCERSFFFTRVLKRVNMHSKGKAIFTLFHNDIQNNNVSLGSSQGLQENFPHVPAYLKRRRKKEESSKDPQSQDRYHSFKEGSDENLLLLKIILGLLDLPLVLAQWSLRVPSRCFRITKARGHPPRPSPLAVRLSHVRHPVIV